VRDNFRHLIFSVKNNFFPPRTSGCKFIYAHYWNKCKAPTSKQIYNTELFFKQLIDDGWLFVSMDDLNIDLCSEYEKKIFLSFDDGFTDITVHWHNIASSLNIKYTIFINPKFVEDVTHGSSLYDYHLRFNNKHICPNWDKIHSLNESSLCDIQFHGLSHKRLSDLEWDDFLEEIEEGDELINNRLGKRCEGFAWPYGTFDDVKEKQIIYLKKRYQYLFSAGRNKYAIKKGIINRDHFELAWPDSSLSYLLKRKRIYS